MAHTHEKLCYTVEVFIVHKDRVLLRMHDKYHVWMSVGGHIDLGEDPITAAIREVKEEVGLAIELWSGAQRFADTGSDTYRELIPPVALNRNTVSPTHEHLTLVYFARSESDDVRPSEGERQDGWRWCSKKDVETMDILPDIRLYALAALEELGGK